MQKTKYVVLSLFLSLSLITDVFAALPSVVWSHQYGTSGSDVGDSVAIDASGNVYVSGITSGDLAGPNVGLSDAYLRKYNSTGSLLWTRQLGTVDDERSYGLSVDTLGNAYFTGSTKGDLEGTNSGNSDAFLSKYDSSGNPVWTRQFGTSSLEESRNVLADSLGNVYVTGRTDGGLSGANIGQADAFLRKYDSAGAVVWTQQLGTIENDISFHISTDVAGNLYIAGQTTGDLEGPNIGSTDAFLRKYNSAGSVVWTKQLGTVSFDASYGVSSDQMGNIYITGRTDGDFSGTNAGGRDAFVSKYDTSGALQWTEQLGTSGDDFGFSVSADTLGNVYIAGLVEGTLGATDAGGIDVFLSKYDAAGTLAWTEQLGTSSADLGRKIVADSLGFLYLTGDTFGDLIGTSSGGRDAFLYKLRDNDVVPEPGALVLALLCGLIGLVKITRNK